MKREKIKGMEVFTYTSEEQLRAAAAKAIVAVLDTRTSFSFRIFKDKKCTEFHVYKKPQ